MQPSKRNMLPSVLERGGRGVDGVAVAAIKIANHFELSIVPPPSCNSSGAKKGPGHEPIFLSPFGDGFKTANLSSEVNCSSYDPILSI